MDDSKVFMFPDSKGNSSIDPALLMALNRSIVGISPTTSKEQLLNTIVHEAKHVQSHICRYYNVTEDSENAAYLIGYIIQKMYKGFKKYL